MVEVGGSKKCYFEQSLNQQACFIDWNDEMFWLKKKIRNQLTKWFYWIRELHGQKKKHIQHINLSTHF